MYPRAHPTLRGRALARLAAVPLVLGCVVAGAPAHASSATVTNTGVTLTMADGVGLAGILSQPGTPGPHPALVLVSSWALPDFEYLAQAQQFAAEGYIVLEYDPRGFYNSGGTIDVASPADVRDVSTVIDWLLARTAADPAEIGVGGVSYGAGISLLAAAQDPRIKATASLSTWTDLGASLLPNRTRHLESTSALAALGAATGRLSDDFQTQLDDFYADTNISSVLSWAAVRSPRTYLDRINANGTAVFLANGLQDSIFSPNQIADFYTGLTTPKYAMLSPGDHATPEAGGLLGLPNAVWDKAHAWFDHYLTGAANSIGTDEPVQIEPVGGSAYTGYPSFAAAAGNSRTFALGATDWLGTGSLGSAGSNGWSTRISSGTDTCADGGVLFVTGILTQFADAPPACWLPAISRGSGAVWESSALSGPLRVRGAPSLHLTITPGTSHGSLFAYLYDVNALGVGSLVSYLPYSYLDATAGQPITLDAQLLTAAYDFPAGDHVGLVVDTKDPLFIDEDSAGGALAFSSPSGDSSVLTLPGS